MGLFAMPKNYEKDGMLEHAKESIELYENHGLHSNSDYSYLLEMAIASLNRAMQFEKGEINEKDRKISLEMLLKNEKG